LGLIATHLLFPVRNDVLYDLITHKSEELFMSSSDLHLKPDYI